MSTPGLGCVLAANEASADGDGAGGAFLESGERGVGVEDGDGGR